MKILVTGGSGFLGKQIITSLLGQGNKVVNIDVIPSGLVHQNLFEQIIDINNLKTLHNSDAVVHCAALVPASKNNKAMIHVNRNGTQNLLELSLKHKIQRFIYISSSAVYGKPTSNPVNSSSFMRPFEIYGKSKLMAEEICKEYLRLGVPISIIRPRTILGYSRSGLFSFIFLLVQQGKKIPILSNGKNYYQFIDVDDFVSLIHEVLKNNSNLEINVGAKEFSTMRSTLEGLIQHAKSESTLINVPKPILKIVMALSKVRLLPFAPYQLQMYSESMWFDINELDKSIKWVPRYTSVESMVKSYDTFIQSKIGNEYINSRLSLHSKPINSPLLRLMIRFLP
jgi:nucleoside-diphosphate-sugar epimerase